MEYLISITFGAEDKDAFEKWLVSLSGGTEPNEFGIAWFRVERVDSVLERTEELGRTP